MTHSSIAGSCSGVLRRGHSVLPNPGRSKAKRLWSRNAGSSNCLSRKSTERVVKFRMTKVGRVVLAISSMLSLGRLLLQKTLISSSRAESLTKGIVAKPIIPRNLNINIAQHVLGLMCPNMGILMAPRKPNKVSLGTDPCVLTYSRASYSNGSLWRYLTKAGLQFQKLRFDTFTRPFRPLLGAARGFLHAHFMGNWRPR